jgi:hypothetical protein
MVPNSVPTFAVAAEIGPMVIGGWAAAGVVFLCAVSARLFLSARHCNMAVGPALVALGHDALTMEDFAILGLMVVYEPFKYQSVGFFWCSHIDQERPRELAVLQCSFHPGHLQEFHLAL